MMDITKHIKDTVNEYKQKDKHIKKASDINCSKGSYFCRDLAEDVVAKVPGSEVKWGPDHTFVKYKDKYYDSESPRGVTHPNKLSHYKRSSRKYAENYFGEGSPGGSL